MKKTSSKVEEFIRVDHAGERGAITFLQLMLFCFSCSKISNHQISHFYLICFQPLILLRRIRIQYYLYPQ